MDDVGFIYVPEKCYSKECHLHVVFHGCSQARDKLGTAYAENTGFLEWAAANDLLILFP